MLYLVNNPKERYLFERYEEQAEFFEFDENSHNSIMADCDLFEDIELWTFSNATASSTDCARGYKKPASKQNFASNGLNTLIARISNNSNQTCLICCLSPQNKI